MLREAKGSGYQIHLHYLWLPNSNIAVARVRERVKKGGHHVPTADVRRRFTRSLKQLVEHYAPIADRWAIWDNQTSPPSLITESETCSMSDLQLLLESR